MVILYVKGKKAAKEGNLSRELRGGYARKTLAFGFFTVDPFFDRFSRRDGRFWHHSDKPILPTSNSQSVMPGCSHPKSIQGPDRGDRH